MVEQCYYQSVLHVAVKKSIFMKEQEAKGTLSSIGLKTPLIGDSLF